jgi:hypothetical protein
MSKFIDRLKEALHPAPQPMGFGRRAEAKKRARLVLVAALDRSYTEGLGDVLSAADGVLLPVDSPPGNVEVLSKAANGTPCGEWLSANDAPKLEALAKDGCDFLIFRPEKMGLNLLQYEKVGKIMEVDAQIEDALLRAAGTLPVDAVFVRHEESEPSYFTWRDLMVYRHFADFVGKPVMVTVTMPLTEKELLALWEAGVDALVVAAGPGTAGELLKRLRQEIDKVVFPAERRMSKREAVIPPSRAEAPTPQKEEEEEDGDEEEDE